MNKQPLGRKVGRPFNVYLFAGQRLTVPQIMEHTGWSSWKVRNHLLCGRFYSPDELRDTHPNVKINGHPIFYEGKTLALFDWAREKGINPHTLHWRISKGWSVHDALTRPVRRRRAPTPGGMSELSALPRGPVRGVKNCIAKDE